MPDFDFMNRMNSRATNSNINPADFVSRLTQEQNNVIRSTYMQIKDQPKKYTDMLYVYNKAKYLVDNAQYIYSNPDNDPREEAHAENFSNMMSYLYPQLSKDVIRGSYKTMIKSLYGDDMDATNVMQVVGSKISQGFSQSWLGLKTYLFSIGQNLAIDDEDVKKQKIADYRKAVNTAMSQYKRTDYYNKDFDSFLEQAVLSAADFIPSEVFSLAPSLVGMALTAVTGVPLFYTAGKTTSVAMAGFMEAGSSAMEMMRAGADVDTIAAFSTVVGLINGILEHVGNIPEEKVAARLFEVQKLKKQIGSISGYDMSGLVSTVMKKWGTDYAMGFLTEPGTEMVQELVSMLGNNLASMWEEKHKGKAFSDEFTYTIDEMIDAMKEVGLSTLKGQTVMGLTTFAGNAINDMKKGGSFLGMKTESGDLRRILETRKYSEQDANSRLVGSESVVTDNVTKAYEPYKTKDDNGKTTTEKINGVDVVNINGKLYPVDSENMAKAKYMKKANGKYGMYVNIITETEAKDMRNASKEESSYVISNFGKKETPLFVSDDGEIQVNPNDFDSTVVSVMNSLGKDYSGVSDKSTDGMKVYQVYGKDKKYTITDNIKSTSEAVTPDTTLRDMLAQKGESLPVIRKDFESNLKKLFEKRGLTGDNLTKTVNDFIELAENLSPTAKNLAEQISKLRKVDEDLAEQIAYGISGMVAEFKTISDIDSDWAKTHVVLDDKLMDNENQTAGGKSVWKVGDKSYKNYLDIPVSQRKDATFHISVSDMVNQTTGIHEIGHMALSLGEEKFLADDWFKTAFYKELQEDNKGIDDERQWKIGDKTHEAFASKLETYIDTGVAESKEQASLFKRILRAAKAFFDKIYNSLTKDQLEFYDRLFNVDRNEEISSDSADISQNTAENVRNEENTSENEDYSIDSEEEDYLDEDYVDPYGNAEYDEYGSDDYSRYQKFSVDDKETLNKEIENLFNKLASDGTYVSGDEFENTMGFLRMPDSTKAEIVAMLNQYMEDRTKYSPEIGFLAPNGLKSNLSPFQYAQVRTDAFKNWFGDWINYPKESSKIVDENGEPLVVYHTSHSDFEQFDYRFIGSTTGNKGIFTKGFYFTENDKYADSYKYYGGLSDEAYRVSGFLNIRNPYIWDEADVEKAIEMGYPKDNVREYGLMYLVLSDEIERFTEGLQNAGFDGVIVDLKTSVYDRFGEGTIHEYVAYNPNQIKSAIDNNGDFSTEDNRFRYQRVDRTDFQKLELDMVNDALSKGEMLPTPELTRYRQKSDWAKADQVAVRINVDGDLLWMSELLNSIVNDVKGKTVEFNEISDADWELIQRAFEKHANEKIDQMYKKHRKADDVNGYFNGNDVQKVLKRLYVNNLNTSHTAKVTAWLNKYTGKDATAGNKNVKYLAMKLKELGIFDRDKKNYNGLDVSERFRFLDTLLQTMYTGSEDRHYDETRASTAVWMGAQQEILDNAEYLMAIDQNYTPRKEGGIKRTGVEDTEIAPKYQSFAEKDIRKSYEDKIKAENELAQKQEELANALGYAEDILKERDKTVDELKQIADKYGIDTDGMYTVRQVTDAIMKADEKVAKENEKVLKKAEDIQKKLDDARDDIRRIKSDMNIAQRDYRELEVQNRTSLRAITRLTNQISELTDKLKDNKKELKRLNDKSKRLDDALEELDRIREKDSALKSDYDNAMKDLRKAKRDLEKKDKELEAKENANIKLTGQTKLDDAVIRQLDANLNQVLDELTKEIKRKEKYARALWLRNEEIADMRARRLIENSRRNWREILTRKSGDATTDKALAMFANAFFQRTTTNMVNKRNAHPFKVLDIDGNPDIRNAISHDGVLYNSKNEARHVSSLYKILTDEGFIVDGKLVKGFDELQLGRYKEVSDAIRVARNESNSASSQRTEARKNLVKKMSAKAKNTIKQLGLSSADRKEARKRFLNGEFETLQMAELAVWKERKPYIHEGTQEQKKRKKGLSYGKRFNANNNVGFNSFTSGYNMLRSISPELGELFFFGSDDMEGINKVTDEYLKKVDERKQIVEKAVTEYYNGDKKAVQKFMKESQKTVHTEQMDVDKLGIPAWLGESQAFMNFLGTQEFNDKFSDEGLTLEEVIAIYEHSKQNEDLAHILQERANISARQVAWIVNEFEREDGVFNKYKGVADAYQHGYEKAWDRFQKVANDVYDMALTHYDFYSPARTADRDTSIELLYDFDANGMPHSYGKKLTMAERADMQMKTGGNNPISLSYITGFNNIVRSQEWFINAANFFKTWNDMMKNDGGGLRREIDDRFGSGTSFTVMKWMNSVANSEFDDVASGLNKYMDTIRNHMALANLGFSVSSTFQQPSVMFLAASKFGYRKMFSALSQIKTQGGLRDFVDYVHSKSPQIKAFADSNIAYAKQAISDSRFLKAVGLAQDIAEIGMKGIEYTDQFCRCLTWEMGYEYYIEKGFSEEDASMRATQDTMNMNSSRQAKDNSLAYNSKSPLWKGLLLFTNQLNKQWNMLIGEDGVKALFNGNVKQFVSTVMGLGMATTWVLLAKGKLFNSDDDEKWWEDLWEDYLGEGISVVPVIGDKISSVINGYSYLDSDLVTSTTSFLRQAFAEDKGKKTQKMTTAGKNMAVDFLELIGAPKVVFKNTYNALFENGKWVGDEYFTSGRYVRQLLPYEWYQFVTGDK